jgi:hypothetical protein
MRSDRSNVISSNVVLHFSVQCTPRATQTGCEQTVNVCVLVWYNRMLCARELAKYFDTLRRDPPFADENDEGGSRGTAFWMNGRLCGS